MRSPEERVLRSLAAAITALGIGVATYIAIVDASGGTPTCLAGGGGCETVASSSYSHLMGINVAVFGILGYALLLVATLVRGDLGRFGGFALSLVGFGFSAYLTYLELFKIHAICQWCVGSAVLMTALFALNTTRLLIYGGIDTDAQGLGTSSHARIPPTEPEDA